MSDLSKIPVLVPESVDDPADLPLAVLDAACNHLGCDIVAAAQGKESLASKRYAAWAELCYQWARLTGVDKPKRETYREYTAAEAAHALGLDREPADPTEPTDESESGSSESP